MSLSLHACIGGGQDIHKLELIRSIHTGIACITSTLRCTRSAIEMMLHVKCSTRVENLASFSTPFYMRSIISTALPVVA